MSVNSYVILPRTYRTLRPQTIDGLQAQSGTFGEDKATFYSGTISPRRTLGRTRTSGLIRGSATARHWQ